MMQSLRNNFLHQPLKLISSLLVIFLLQAPLSAEDHSLSESIEQWLQRTREDSENKDGSQRLREVVNEYMNSIRRHRLEENLKYRKAVELDPKDFSAYVKLGETLIALGELGEANAAFRKAIALNPKFSYAHDRLGFSLSRQRRFGQAIAAYREAIKLNPSYIHTYYNLGAALQGQKKINEAIEAYQLALSLPDQPRDIFYSSIGIPSGHATIHNALGLAFQELGELEAAIFEFRKAISLDRYSFSAKTNLESAERWLEFKRNPPQFAVDERMFIPNSNDEPLVSILRSTARIITRDSNGGSSIGAGWVVKREDNTIWVVTNRHVVIDRYTRELSSEINVEFFSRLNSNQRPRYTATVEHITQPDEELDLAVLKVGNVPSDIQPLNPYTGSIRLETPVRVIGHPANVRHPWSVVPGSISNVFSNILSLDATIAEGNSGGPVINKDRQIIGMVVVLRMPNDIALNPSESSSQMQDFLPATRGVSEAYPINAILQQLRDWRILK